MAENSQLVLTCVLRHYLRKITNIYCVLAVFTIWEKASIKYVRKKIIWKDCHLVFLAQKMIKNTLDVIWICTFLLTSKISLSQIDVAIIGGISTAFLLRSLLNLIFLQKKKFRKRNILDEQNTWTCEIKFLWFCDLKNVSKIFKDRAL